MEKSKNIRIRIDQNGYEYFCESGHPLAYKNTVVYYHRYIASFKVGHWLTGDEHVHHIDGNRTNNAPENLAIMSSSEHGVITAIENGKTARGRACSVCGEFTKNKFFCSSRCVGIAQRRVGRPSRDVLDGLLQDHHSWMAIGRMYGVTDNAVRKWARSYGII